MSSFLLAIILPLSEWTSARAVAAEYGLTKDETALLCAIRRVENGRPGLEFGVASDYPRHPSRRYADGTRSFVTQARWAAGTIRKRYDGNIRKFASVYCPPNASRWSAMVNYYMKEARKDLP